MASKLRLGLPGAIYHSMHRGDRQGAIFQGDADREMGIPKGSAARRRRFERLMEERRGPSHYGEELQESATEKASG